MKITCTQENFSKGLTIVARFGDKNINLPILNNVLIQARKEGVVLSGTNLEIAIQTNVRGKIEEEGEFTTNARLLTDFVNSLKKENISVVLEEKNLHIQGENHQTTVRGLDAAEFPVIPDVDSKFSVSLPAKELRQALSQVLFAVSSDESRPELTGVFVQLSDRSCILAATDSYRLAEKTVGTTTSVKEPKQVIIPAKTIAEVLRILDIEEPEKATLAINDSQALFTLGGTKVISRIIAGEYPDYRQIIPSQFKDKISFSTDDMVAAVKTTSLFCKQGINDVRLSLDKRFTDIAITAENSTFGKNISNVSTASKGQEVDIVFNYKFLLDGLNHVMGDESVLKANDAVSPALLMSASEKDFLYIIMPIKQ